MRKDFSCFVSVGLLALLAGCGGGGSGDSEATPPPPDTTPASFSFTDENGTALASAVTSNAIVVSGINSSASVSITGGEYSIDGGPYSAAAGTVSNNQTIRVRVTTPNQFTTSASATLTVGGVSASFTVKTRDADTTPNAIQFSRRLGATRDEWVASDTVTISGIEIAVPLSIEDGEYAIDNGAFTSAAGTISAGQSLILRTKAAATYSRTTRARVTVGTLSTIFEVTSELPAYIPDSLDFDGQDILFLRSNVHKLIFRWSMSEERYLDPYDIAVAPTTMAYSSNHQRLYLGYSTGAIRYIDVTASDPAERPFANIAMSVNGLASVGNYVLAQDPSGAWATHYVINSNGVITDSAEWNYFSRAYAWDPAASRVYFFRDDTSPNDLHFEVIDQATGQISAAGETPYHGSYAIVPPIRVSSAGQYVLLGSGDIYERTALAWSGSVGAQLVDARWFANNSVVTLSTASNQTTLRRLGTNLANLEQLTYAGQALRIVGTDARMAVLVINSGTVQFHIYVPSNDSDGDGVSNTEDAFPLDAAASIDTDRDGYPDAWNVGKSQSDSTTGLSLDAFPEDAACYLPSHGSGGNCNYGATIPSYVPDQVVSHGDTVYLLSSANRRVYRWSIATEEYLNPYVVGIDQGFSTIAPTKMAYSEAHERLYLGYSTGSIQYIDVTSSDPAERPFANIAMSVNGLASVGNYVLAQDPSGAWATHYVINSNGVITDSAEWNYFSREYAWDPVTSRVYFFRDDTSPNDLHYEVIDQATGTIASAGEAPYHGTYSIIPPIRVSPGGQYVLLGSGDIYSQSGLTWSGSVGSQVRDARWFANGSLVTLATLSNQTTLRRLGTTLVTQEQLTYTGQALRVIGSDTRMAVLVVNNGTVDFHIYVPSNDSDGDGVLNTQDAFPLDPAASVDTDGDGYPDAWNPGRSQSDSTTGLSLDAFPQDSACYLPSHGSGGTCNYGATVPDYVPDKVAASNDTVYLLSSANKRVYRWSITTEQYLNPYVVGIDQGFSTLAPTMMAYSSAHQRLYLGYSTGAIRYIDVSSGSMTEVPFVNTAAGVQSLASVGNYLLAPSYLINSSGVITDQAASSFSRDYAWDPVTSRVYFFRDNSSPNDLHYQVINQATGQTGSGGETPYHGAYNIEPPIRVSPNGQYVVLGSGDIYESSGLTWTGSLGTQFVDGRFFADGSLLTLTTGNNQTTLRRLDTSFANVEQLTYAGQALRVVGADAKMVVLTINSGTVQFYPYVRSNDNDGDGVSNTQDAFPLDPAASVDTDRDGYPDAWNPGQSQSDSTTGLSLDAFPQDSACYLPSHGSGGTCDYEATVPAYFPDQVVDDGDIVYLLSSANSRVYRWSIATESYLNPYVVGIDQGFGTLAPTLMAYSSAHDRLYLGYSSGAIRYIDLTSGSTTEVSFSSTAKATRGLVAVGNYVLAQDDSGAWATHYVIDSNGVITDQAEWNHYSRTLAWDPVTSRVYYFRDGVSPNDLHYEVIDQATGQITSAGESPFHGSITIQPPIRVSPDGQSVVLGNGAIYHQAGLTWAGSVGSAIADGHWKDNLFIGLHTSDRLDIRDRDSYALLASYQYPGLPLRLVFGQTEAYLVHVVNDTTEFLKLPFGDEDQDSLPRWWEELYGLSDSVSTDALGDLDGDGVSNEDEYAHRSSPVEEDSDSDGLTDFDEIVTHATDPAAADSDEDGLEDQDEVLTYLSDPWDGDSDDDTYTDHIEVLHGGDPANATALPQPLVNYSQSFESSSLPPAWATPPHSQAGWSIDATTARTGSASLRADSGTSAPYSSIRFRGLFATGVLGFYSRVGNTWCCNYRLDVYVDGAHVLSTAADNQWNRSTIPITPGAHDIEWRYQKEPLEFGSDPDPAWIDDVTFAP